MKLILDSADVDFNQAFKLLFGKDDSREIEFSSNLSSRVLSSHNNFKNWFDKKIPLYGINTGFGDSCHRTIDNEQSKKLQDNLISYLLMGTGKLLTEEVGRSILFFRIVSLSRGYSGISMELLEKMKELFNKGIYPVIPREGSLGASGDLIPLAYIGENLRGQGDAYYKGEIVQMEDLVSKGLYSAYELGPKEGLAIVNGTSAMVGLCFYNYSLAYKLVELAETSTSWLTLAIGGRTEAFGPLVNSQSKRFEGQGTAAKNILSLLDQENYKADSYDSIESVDGKTSHFVQDPYSLRCASQVLGPIKDTLSMIKSWVQEELNGASDNPLFDQEDGLANGGNFYGGYLSHSMDYLKICMGNLADLLDRQLTLLINDKTNRGLPPNLANWDNDNLEDNHLNHGLKGVHQNVSAVTSEIMALCIPNSIFSRSSESHNQDKVSLGMSGATQCFDQLEKVTSVVSSYLLCLCQALDLKKIELKGSSSRELYAKVREESAFVAKDRRLDRDVAKLNKMLLSEAFEGNLNV